MVSEEICRAETSTVLVCFSFEADKVSQVSGVDLNRQWFVCSSVAEAQQSDMGSEVKTSGSRLVVPNVEVLLRSLPSSCQIY